jgi:streptogramin lyase
MAPDGAFDTFPAVPPGARTAELFHLISDPDGNIWFTSLSGNAIGLIRIE